MQPFANLYGNALYSEDLSTFLPSYGVRRHRQRLSRSKTAALVSLPSTGTLAVFQRIHLVGYFQYSPANP